MIISEMHLSVLQRLQEVGSYKRNKFRSEEIDMALNKAMHRLLEQGVENKFQGTQINLSHVSALIQKNKISEVIIPQTTDPLYEENMSSVYSVIPPGLYYLINGRAEVITNPLNCTTAPSLTTSTSIEYISKIPFTQEGAAGTYFANTSLVSNILGTLYTMPSTMSVGFNNLLARFVVIEDILNTVNKAYVHTNTRLYWERYRDTYTRNNFLLVNLSDPGTITLTSNAVVTTGTNTNTSYTIYNRALISAITSKTVEVNTVRINREDSLYSSLKNNYYKSRPKEPVVDQTFDYFIIYRDGSFIVTRFYYDYIRKPRAISLNLKQDCELSPTIHPKVVDLAVELLKLDTKDQSYPATVQDTQNRTV